MTFQNFERAIPMNLPLPTQQGVAKQDNSELRATALGIQAWLDGSAEPIFQDVLVPKHQSKQKPTRQKRSQ